MDITRKTLFKLGIAIGARIIQIQKYNVILIPTYIFFFLK